MTAATAAIQEAGPSFGPRDPGRRVGRLAPRARRRGTRARRSRRAPARAASARSRHRGRSAPVERAGRGGGPRRPRQPGGGRRADGRPEEASQLPRGQPLHDLGVQVRAARGRRGHAQAPVARARAPTRGRRVGALSGRADVSGGSSGSVGADRRHSRRDRRGAHPHQRGVLVALTLNDVPIDVLAERRGTTRNALYKTLHDGRRKLRARLAEDGLEPSPPDVRAPATRALTGNGTNTPESQD